MWSASWVMGFISLYKLSCSAVDMRCSWYWEFKCVLSAHDWIHLHSSLLHLWLLNFGILSNKWPQNKCNFNVSSLGTLSQLPWSHVQLCPDEGCLLFYTQSGSFRCSTVVFMFKCSCWTVCMADTQSQKGAYLQKTTEQDTVGIEIEWGGGGMRMVLKESKI